jgi:hypothetical protein
MAGDEKMTAIYPDLPEAIPVPAATAAEFAIATGEPTARDLAFAVSVLHLASVHGAEKGRIEILDNALRGATGQYSRLTVEREDEKYARLGATLVHVPGGEAALPSMFMHDVARSQTIAGGVVWTVDPLLQEAFTPRPGEPVVHLPMYLLRNARSRHAVVLALKMLSWWSGMVDPAFEHTRRDGYLMLRMPINDLRSAMGVSGSVSPSNLMGDVLVPAAAEVSRYSDHQIEIEPIRTRYRDGKVGKLAFFEIRIAALAPDQPRSAFLQRVEQLREARRAEWELKAQSEADRLVALERGSAKPRTWRRPSRTRPKPPRPAPADVSNVVPMSVDTILSAFVQDPIAVPRPPLRPAVHSADSRGDD